MDILGGYPFTCSPWSFFERKKILKNQFTFFKKNMITCLFESQFDSYGFQFLFEWLCSCFSKKHAGFSGMICRCLLTKPDRLNLGFLQNTSQHPCQVHLRKFGSRLVAILPIHMESRGVGRNFRLTPCVG